jgi:quinol-cytochrome oxidoreductase complex cytochrome b subunit
MILLLRHGATEASIKEVKDAVNALGLNTTPLDDRRGRALEVVGEDPSRVLGLRGLAAIEEILTRRTPLRGGEPVWPHFSLRLVILVLLLLVVLSMLSAFIPVGLGDRAGASQLPGSPVVEWYLRPLVGLRNLLGPGARVATALFWVLFFAWPFLDRVDTPMRRMLLKAMGIALIVLILALGTIG